MAQTFNRHMLADGNRKHSSVFVSHMVVYACVCVFISGQIKLHLCHQEAKPYAAFFSLAIARFVSAFFELYSFLFFFLMAAGLVFFAVHVVVKIRKFCPNTA